MAFLATAVNAVLLVYMLRDQLPLSWLGIWFGALLVLTLVRMRLVHQYRRQDPPPAEAARWGRWFVAGSLLSGIIWGSAGALFFPDGSAAHQMFLAFVLGGMAAGGMSTLSSYRGAYPIFLLPTLLPYAARAMLNGGEIQFTMSLMVLFFTTMMWTISLRIYRRLEESLFLRFHNMDLLSTVLLARDRQQAANLELQAEISKKQRAEQALQSAYVDLERRVRERTEELALSNDILVREKELFRITLASIGDAVITTDSNGRMTYLNAAAEQFTGWTSEEAIGMPLRQGFLTLDEVTREPIGDPLIACQEPGHGPGHGNPCILLRRDNQELAIDQSVAPIRDRKGKTIGAVLTFRDVTEQRQLTRKLSHQATHDALTGLVNRHEFERRLSQVLLSAEATDPHALLYLDLDQFKVVNDTCGHIAGDELLRQVAALLQSKVRVHDTLARLGGDEFGILLEHCPQAQAIRIANTLRELIQGFRFGWEDKSFTIGVSVGLFSISRPGESLANALSAADSACYAAKDMGRNRVHTYEPDDSVLTKRQGEMRGLPRIQQALVDERLRLYYQPIVPIGEGHGDGDKRHGEILLRLLDEQGSLIPPGAFLPAAERYDQMLAIDRWVVRSCLERLPTPAGGEREVLYAINLSAQALGDSDFLEFVVDQLKEKGPAPSSICFEITENAAIADLRHVMRFISTLKEYGRRFSLDDFGSGLSSFGYLKTLPVDFLKIDGRLVRDMVTNKVDRSMVEAIHNIGHVMGIKTIAEWVEDAETLSQLREIGVNFAQGYGLAEPMPFVPERLTRAARMN
ncbi:MAG: EAL domain-containing protein [Methylotetracoccus sp.]